MVDGQVQPEPPAKLISSAELGFSDAAMAERRDRINQHLDAVKKKPEFASKDSKDQGTEILEVKAERLRQHFENCDGFKELADEILELAK